MGLTPVNVRRRLMLAYRSLAAGLGADAQEMVDEITA
ncbi:hypothetical protein [Citreicoccus inhibens]